MSVRQCGQCRACGRPGPSAPASVSSSACGDVKAPEPLGQQAVHSEGLGQAGHRRCRREQSEAATEDSSSYSSPNQTRCQALGYRKEPLPHPTTKLARSGLKNPL